MTITGWLFDAYATEKGITVWFIDVDGKKHKTQYNFRPSFYLNLTKDEEHFLDSIRKSLPSELSLCRVEKRDLYSRAAINVLEVSVHNPLMFQKVVYALAKQFNFYKFYGGDIKTMQLFYYVTQLFPLAYGDYEIENDSLRRWSLKAKLSIARAPVLSAMGFLARAAPVRI